ncbi:helix-turn-helix transcriptional regulator [Fusobacterium sp.]|uniref:helix-turn-helix transcriptional regulator n=1 Tax=Fusobacterium sp. TaxID=68766 RepID=UPI0026351D47|nr:response regulator transcription factor [Fusobacterium sp.]
MLKGIGILIKEKLKTKTKKIIFIIVMFFSCVIISLNSYNELTKEERYIESKTSRLYENIRKKSEIVSMTLYDLKSSEAFNNYIISLSDNYNLPFTKVKLFKELVKRNTIYGKIGYYLNMTDNISTSVITPFGTIDKKSFYSSLGFPEDIEDKKEYINYDGENINLYYEDSLTLKNDTISYIISLDEDIFLSELIPEGKYWYIFSKDKVINIGNYNKKNSEIEKQLVKILEKDKYKIIGSNGYITKILGKRAHIFYDPSFDFTLLYLEPQIDIFEIIIYESIKVFSIVGILYGIFLLAISFIVKPMKQLAKKLGYEENKEEKEIDYIKTKIEEIETMNETLKNRMISLRNYQKKKKIKDYLIGISENDGVGFLKEESEIFKVNKYRVMIMEIYDIEAVENIFDKFNMSKEVISKYFSKDITCEIVDIDYKSIAFIMEELLPKEKLEEALKNLVRDIDINFGLNFTVVATNVYNDVSQMPKAYRIAKKILDYKYIFKQERVIFQEKISENTFNKYYYPIELESKLILRTLNSNEISVKRIIDEMFNEKNSSSMDKKYIKEFGVLLYNTLNRIFIQLQEINEDIKVKDYNINEILEINDAVTLKEVFQSKILKICKLIKIEEENDIGSVKIKIERYLAENYMVDISLENLADYLGHSFKYTSVLFKKVIGDNFKNYLSIYRIEKAKELMRENPNLRIKDLAELTGYNSSNTFIRIFRKYEGMSPGKYFGIVEQENS